MIQIIVKKKAALARSGLWIARKAGRYCVYLMMINSFNEDFHDDNNGYDDD
jgi:hypothetical protein